MDTSCQRVDAQRSGAGSHAPLESLRGGEIPLDEVPVQLSGESDATRRRTVHTFVRVEELEIEGLYEVTVRSRAHLLDQPLEVELHTMVWRP